MMMASLDGLRVMVVEDELLIAILIEDVLLAEGCRVVGPFSTVARALAGAASEAIDLALLDVNVGGEKVYPVAELLDARQIPFVLLSGYGRDAVPQDRPSWRVYSKPFEPERLVRYLAGFWTDGRRR